MKLPVAARLAGLALAFGLCAALIPGAASSATLTVNATVSENCIVGAGTLSFGAYDPVLTNHTSPAQDLTAQTNVTVTCTKSASFTNAVTLGGDAGGGGSCTTPSTTRSMKNGSNQLCYELYTTTGRTQAWGTSGAGLIPVFSSGAAGGGISGSEPQSVTIYGTVPAGQDVVGSTAGLTYTDAVTMTVNF